MKYKMKKSNAKKPFFALSKCFIAPSALDFPMPPSHWTTSPESEICAIEECATNYIATSTSYKINDLFSYHMKAMVNIEICANKLVNSTSTATEINCKVSYNMQMNVNIKTCNELEGINKVISNVMSGVQNSTSSKNLLQLQAFKQTEKVRKPLINTNKHVMKTCEELEEINSPLKKKPKFNMKTCDEIEAINNSLNNTSIIITYEEFEAFLISLNTSSKQIFKTCRESEGVKSFNTLNVIA